MKPGMERKRRVNQIYKKRFMDFQNGSKKRLKGAQLIANPGCYPTASALGLIPALPYIDPKSIIIDAKSCVSGAGRSASLATIYGEVNENLSAYKGSKSSAYT